MAVSAKTLKRREKILKALKELKPTHTFQEISEKIGEKYWNIKRIYRLYGEPIPFTPETRKRVLGSVVNGKHHSNKVCNLIVELRNKGLTFSEIGKELHIPERSAVVIFHRLIKSNPKLNQPKVKELPPATSQELEESMPFSERLVLKYAKEQRFDLTPLFLVKTHQIRGSTAAKICEKLKILGSNNVCN